MLLKQARPGAQRNPQINELNERLRSLEDRDARLKLRMGLREIGLAKATESYQDSCLKPLRLRDLIIEPFRLQWINAMEGGRRADLLKCVKLSRERNAIKKQIELVGEFVEPPRKRPAFRKQRELAEGVLAD